MLINSFKATHHDKLMAIATIHRALAELFMPVETIDLEMSECGRDGLANLFALLEDTLLAASG